MKGRKFVLTGGIGFGKSTILTELKKIGFYIVPSVADIVCREIKKSGKKEILKDTNRLSKAILEKQHELEVKIPPHIDTFCERGLLDSIAFIKQQGLEPDEEILRLVNKHSYDKIFVIGEIANYSDKNMKFRSINNSREILKLTSQIYRHFGYSTVFIEDVDIKERVSMILDNIPKPWRLL